MTRIDSDVLFVSFVANAEPRPSSALREAAIQHSHAAFALWRWWRSRDLGRLDDGGYLYLEGRRDDMIISGGINIMPARVPAVSGLVTAGLYAAINKARIGGSFNSRSASPNFK